MNLSTTTKYPTLTEIVNTPATEDGDAADNSNAFSVTGAAGSELKALLKDGRVASDGGLRSCGADIFLLFDGNLRVRLGGGQPPLSARDVSLSNENGSYMKDVTGTDAGPWWKALRGAIRDALAVEAEEMAADQTVLANTWAADGSI